MSISEHIHHNPEEARNVPSRHLPLLMTTPALRPLRPLSSPCCLDGGTRWLKKRRGWRFFACLSGAAFSHIRPTHRRERSSATSNPTWSARWPNWMLRRTISREMPRPTRRFSTRTAVTTTRRPRRTVRRFSSWSKRCRGDYLNLHMNGLRKPSKALPPACGNWLLTTFISIPASRRAKARRTAPWPRSSSGTPTAKPSWTATATCFHYVIEPCLYGAKATFVEKLDPAAAQALGIKYLPRAKRHRSPPRRTPCGKGDLFVTSCNAWQPRLDEMHRRAGVDDGPTFKHLFQRSA